ncbi:Protein phosphatase methylesterase 1 [Saxophila tyrrhenica]|uniref:Protein phosphatase methylesterase 1 n=1 Tax=Saxophila tyrrhenica TaxID=1690608 RepID=A0AAV9PI40_9PEZI|nr:Protein phosphatase methylesterase 1 [Saxophila tyrrhenica]
MSDLFRQSINKETPPRPKPTPITSTDPDDNSSSSSSADSTASINTVRPTSSEQPPPPEHWSNYFAQELYLSSSTPTSSATYHVYLTPPTDPKKGPLFITHHGAGASGLSFALLAQNLRHRLPEAGILSLEARAHGSVVKSPEDDKEIPDFSITTLTADALAMINLTVAHMTWPTLPPSILIGHSLGGAVVTQLATDFALGTALVGYCVLDVVEGSALEALGHMQTYLASRPSSFASVDEAVAWHTRTRTIRNAESAKVSVPGLLKPLPPSSAESKASGYTWQTNLATTTPYWPTWFTDLSPHFLTARGAKLLILAGTDRLDRELMIGQMQGKFQLTVIPEAGHFVHEDAPEKVGEVVEGFWRRNDRGSMVLPMKVDQMLAKGMKV